MKACLIPASELEGLSQDKSAWPSAFSAGTRRLKRTAMLAGRKKSKAPLRREATTSPDVFPCPECGRTFAAQIALPSHSQGPPETITGGARRIGRHLRLRRTSISKCPRHFSTWRLYSSMRHCLPPSPLIRAELRTQQLRGPRTMELSHRQLWR